MNVELDFIEQVDLNNLLIERLAFYFKMIRLSKNDEKAQTKTHFYQEYNRFKALRQKLVTHEFIKKEYFFEIISKCAFHYYLNRS